MTNKCCICQNLGTGIRVYDFKFNEERTRIDWDFCSNCAIIVGIKMISLCLDPDEWKMFIQKAGGIQTFLTHDDFYDENGNALQPIGVYGAYKDPCQNPQVPSPEPQDTLILESNRALAESNAGLREMVMLSKESHENECKENQALNNKTNRLEAENERLKVKIQGYEILVRELKADNEN